MDEWDKLPPDCQLFIATLAHYCMDEDVGLFIYKSYPEIAAKIGPALRAGLDILMQRHTIHKLTKEFINNYVIKLAQTALDGLEESNSAPATPEADNKTASMIRARAEAKSEQKPDPKLGPDPRPEPESRPATGLEPEREAEKVFIKPEPGPPTKTGLTEHTKPTEKKGKTTKPL